MGDTWLDKKAVQTLLGTPREMSLSDIDVCVADFVHAARISQAAGFAGVQIHAAVRVFAL